jgi:hypothetical protein
MSLDTQIIAFILAICVFLIWCFLCDSNRGENLFLKDVPEDEYIGSAWKAWGCVVAQNVRLVFKLALCFLVAVFFLFSALSAAGGNPAPAASGGGAESEKFYRFANQVSAPARTVVDGFTSLLGFIALGICLGIEWMHDMYFQHLMICNVILLILYLSWLWYTVRGIVRVEYKNERRPEQIFRAIFVFAAWILPVAWAVNKLHQNWG